jgi:hypothetical protein
MTNIQSHAEITTAEIAALWTTYMQMSLSLKMLKHFKITCENEEVQTIVNSAATVTNEIYETTKQLFHQEQLAIPYGFTHEDVNLTAPKLFTEHYMLLYIKHTLTVGMIKFALDKSTATRPDILQFFTTCIEKTGALYAEVVKALSNRGLSFRFPLVNIPNKTEFPMKKSYLSNFFKAQRPLNIIEITQITTSIETNQIGQALLMGFAQTAQSEKIRKYMIRGIEIAKKHEDMFSELLTEEDINSPNAPGNAVSNSTTAPYSDRLMLYHVTFLNGVGISNYGKALGIVTRKDLITNYTRLMIEIADYAEDGMIMMLENGWFEQPPQPVSREELIRE